MQNLAKKLSAAGVEHARTRSIRETVEATASRAKSLQMRAVRAGKAISLAERQRRAAARVEAGTVTPSGPTFSPAIHYSHIEPWERLASAVVTAWR